MIDISCAALLAAITICGDGTAIDVSGVDYATGDGVVVCRPDQGVRVAVDFDRKTLVVTCVTRESSIKASR